MAQSGQLPVKHIWELTQMAQSGQLGQLPVILHKVGLMHNPQTSHACDIL